MSLRDDFEKVAAAIRAHLGEGESYLKFLLGEVSRHLDLNGIVKDAPKVEKAAEVVKDVAEVANQPEVAAVADGVEAAADEVEKVAKAEPAAKKASRSGRA